MVQPYIYCNGMSISLSAGDFLVIHPGAEHSFCDLTQETICCNVLYNSNIAVPIVLMTKSPFIHHLYPGKLSTTTLEPNILGTVSKKDLPKIITMHRYIIDEQKKKRPGHQTIVTSLFTAIVGLLSCYCREENSTPRAWTLTSVQSNLKR